MISFSAMWGDWTVCDDQVLIEDAKGSGVTVPFADKSHQFLIRYWRRSLVKKASPSSETWVCFPAGWFYCYYFELYKTVGKGVGKEWCPPYFWSSSWWNNEINYKIISFGATGGKCSVHSPTHLTRLLWIPACWGHRNVYKNIFKTIMKQTTTIFFRFLRQTRIVEQSSHTSCRLGFPLDMFAFRCCHGMATFPWELSCMVVLTSYDSS